MALNPINNENKVEKSIRNTEAFKAVLARAQKGDYDKELDEARANGELQGTSSRLPLLKVDEHWSIRKHFCIEKGEDYYQLYKEKFYVENPGSNYFETVNPVVYRSVVRQGEQGDAKWAKAVAAHLSIPSELSEAAPAKKAGRPKKSTS